MHYDAAERIIRRYNLTGAGATAVSSLFSPAEGTSASVGIFGALKGKFLVKSSGNDEVSYSNWS